MEFKEFKIWDMHVHNWGCFASPDVLSRHLEETHVDRVTLLGPLEGGVNPSPAEVARSNDRTLAFVERFAPRVNGLCYINPEYPEHALAEWGRCRSRGLIGLKIWVATLCDDAKLEPVLQEVLAQQCPVLIHAWRKVDGNLPGESSADHVARLAARYPTGKFIMAHMAGDWEYGLKAVRHLPNVSVDFAGTVNEAGAYEMAVSELGDDRILFGTDGPADFFHCLARVRHATISMNSKRKILFENASRLFGIL